MQPVVPFLYRQYCYTCGGYINSLPTEQVLVCHSPSSILLLLWHVSRLDRRSSQLTVVKSSSRRRHEVLRLSSPGPGPRQKTSANLNKDILLEIRTLLVLSVLTVLDSCTTLIPYSYLYPSISSEFREVLFLLTQCPKAITSFQGADLH